MVNLLVIEGPDGAGKTGHSLALVAALVAAGYRARRWEHRKPPWGFGDAWSASLHWATERARFRVERDPAEVTVCDRWMWSEVTSWANPALTPDQRQALKLLSDAERLMLPPAATLLLDAPVEALNERIARRGEPLPAHLEDVRGSYLSLARRNKWARVNTQEPKEAVQAAVLAWALEQLS